MQALPRPDCNPRDVFAFAEGPFDGAVECHPVMRRGDTEVTRNVRLSDWTVAALARHAALGGWAFASALRVGSGVMRLSTRRLARCRAKALTPSASNTPAMIAATEAEVRLPARHVAAANRKLNPAAEKR